MCELKLHQIRRMKLLHNVNSPHTELHLLNDRPRTSRRIRHNTQRGDFMVKFN